MSLEKMRKNNARALIVANGEQETGYLKSVAPDYAFIASADGAANHLLSADIKPDLLVGDFDSIEEETLEHYERLGVERISLQKEKDFSDTQVCVEEVIHRGYRSIDLIGGFGGRWDHTMANFNLLFWAFEKKVELRMISAKNTAQLLGEGKHRIPKIDHAHFSFFCFFEDAVVSIARMKYTITDRAVKRGDSLGLSNEYLDGDGEIEIKKGSILMINSLKDK